MHNGLNRDQHGAVAMITVIFIAILLTIITTSFIRIAINEQRLATDDDLTTRAFYAAESGVQDAITAINESIKNNTPVPNADTCTAAGIADSEILSHADGLDTSYSCQLIDTSPVDYQAYLEDGDSVFLKLKSASTIESFVVQWHMYGEQGENGDGLTASARPATVYDLPTLAAWVSADYPAMLRLQVIAVPATGEVRRDNIDSYVGYLNPGASGLTTATSLAHLEGGNDNDPDTADGPFPANCEYTTPGSPLEEEYFCSLTVEGLNSGTTDYYLRVSNLYIPTHIKIEGKIGAGTVVELEGAQAIIDVTGKASDVYRRVEERVNLYQDEWWPEFAITSADDICKNFKITDIAVSAVSTVADFDYVNPGISGSCAP